MTSSSPAPHVAVIGGGFCGLSAAYELGRHGIRGTVLESESMIGGLAGSFSVNGVQLEKFYHHWFTNDIHVMQLVRELGVEENVILRPTRTGVYYANDFFRLSTPLDVLRFSALPVLGRIRLGLLALRARRVEDWRSLEDMTASEWLKAMGGDEVFRVVWEPLLRGKFGDFASDVSAVWFWNKLKLRGGSRGKGGEERLAYYRGGFAALAEELQVRIEGFGGRVIVSAQVDSLIVERGRVVGVLANGREVRADAVIATPPLPIVADLVEPHGRSDYAARLRRVKYLANLCLVLRLDRRLSETYWLNVNDPSFPFVGVIEHTNFQSPDLYGGHICYLSKYLPESDPLFRMTDDEILNYSLPHLKRMFPDFCDDWVMDAYLWRARHAQPVVERLYSQLIPDSTTPLPGMYLASMAQIYPQDRGTNYAIHQGRRIATQVAGALLG